MSSVVTSTTVCGEVQPCVPRSGLKTRTSGLPDRCDRCERKMIERGVGKLLAVVLAQIFFANATVVLANVAFGERAIAAFGDTLGRSHDALDQFLARGRNGGCGDAG